MSEFQALVTSWLTELAAVLPFGFGDEVEGAAPPVWDAYLLYGPRTKWRDELPRPMSSGYTVYGAREKLKKNILPLLE